MEKSKILRVDFKDKKRVIAMSDLHGDLASFEGVLKQLQLSEEDVLIIVGDLIEKGKQSLPLLRKIMEYDETHENFYVLKGNNDDLLYECMDEKTSDEAVLQYMNYVSCSILCEIADELKLPYQSVQDIACLRKAIAKHYRKEMDYLYQLPVILDSPLATFVHAGLSSSDLEAQNEEYCLCAKEFGNTSLVFEKPVVVGHWPSSNYRSDKIMPGIYYNEKNHVYSIDGGNSMKEWEQLNLLIFEDGKIHFDFYDKLACVEALEDQPLNPNAFTLLFPNTEIEVIEQKETESICFSLALNRQISIQNSHIYQYKGKTYCYDFTTYDLEVKKHDCLRLCRYGALFKKDGIVGHYKGKYRIIDAE